MQFRCIAVITLWTFLTGPIFTLPMSSAPTRSGRSATAALPAPKVSQPAAQPAPSWTDVLFRPATTWADKLFRPAR